MATTTPSNGGLGTKKSVFVLITVVGCIAILWPKILYFAMFGGQQTSKAFVKDHRGGTGCCDVVLDQDISANISAAIAHPGFRKRLNLMTGEMSLRQERPPHLRPDGIHPAMRERGRAIPVTSTVPIVAEEKPIPTTVKRIVEGRPGPIPGMRPPMGAGSNHQANHKGNSLGFIMPLYTVGIVAFFVYTVMKLVMKKPINNTPYAEAITSKPEFQDQVFGQDKSVYKKSDGSLTNLGWKDHDTIVTAIQGLIDAADEQLNKKTNSTNLSKDTTGDHNLHATNGNLKVSPEDSANNVKDDEEVIRKLNEKIKILENGSTKSNDLKTKDIHNDKSVKVMGMETTESCEGGRKWLRPSTPSYHAVNNEKPDAEPQAIFLEGALPHDSQILVADSETKTENVFDDDLDGGKEEPAVVICSKMTLSLINMDPVDKSGRNATNDYDEGDDDEAEIDDDDIEEVEEIEDEEVEEVEEVEEIEESEDEKDIAIATKADERVINEKIKSNGKNDKVEEEEEEGSEEEVEEEEEEEVEEEEVEESGTSGDEVKS